ncbi:MAG: hypothetical protein WEA81_03995, partial [Dehalococcoidia bacterium]
MDTNYWSRGRVGRRTVLRSGALGVAGLAGAALIGCGGGDDEEPTASGVGAAAAGGARLDATAAATAAAGTTPVPADQVRIAPGLYDGPAPPSAAELNPSVNAKYGG